MARLGMVLALVCMLAGASYVSAGFTSRKLLQPFCTIADPEFGNYVITSSTAPAKDAAALCASLGSQFTLAKVEANNLFASDQALPNPLNTAGGLTGFPDLRKLADACNPVKPRPISAFTVPGFPTKGTCTGFTVAGGKVGAADKDFANPICNAPWQALCYSSVPVTAPPPFCKISDPEFGNYVITTNPGLVSDAATACADLGLTLAKVEANNLFTSDPTLPNALNTAGGGTGFPDFRILAAACNPVLPRPIAAFTVPGFPTKGTCTGFTAAGGKVGAADKDFADPLCSLNWQSICYSPTPIP